MQMSTQETNCNCKYTYTIASLVHHNWRTGWIQFSGPLWPKFSTFSEIFRTSVQIQDFSGPDFSFFIFQGFSGAVGTLYTDKNAQYIYTDAAACHTHQYEEHFQYAADLIKSRTA